MKKPSLSKRTTLGYIAILAVTLALAIVLGWTALAAQIDDDAYDWMFRLHPPAPAAPHSLILAIDDATFSAMGGVGGYRAMWTKAFELLKRANPKAVALDVVLSDPGRIRPKTSAWASAMQATPNLVLAAHLDNGTLGRSAPDIPSACRRGGSRRRRRAVGGRRHPAKFRSKNEPRPSVIGRWPWRRFGWPKARRIIESPGRSANWRRSDSSRANRQRRPPATRACTRASRFPACH